MPDVHALADAAARWVVEEGLDYASAKRKAVKHLGLNPRTPLPSNETLEDAVRDYLALHCADTQPAQLRALRELALQWMQGLSEFRPLLSGAVWRGTATQHSDIHLQLYCDDPKAAEFTLINRGLRYEVSTQARGASEDTVVLSVLVKMRDPSFTEQQGVWVHMALHHLDDIRGALKPDARGSSERGDIRGLQALLNATTP